MLEGPDNSEGFFLNLFMTSTDVRGAAARDLTAAFEDFQMNIKGSYVMLNVVLSND